MTEDDRRDDPPGADGATGGDSGPRPGVRRRTYDDDGLRDVDLWVRRGNLLVQVGCERWRGDPSAAAMRDDAVKMSRKVLDAYS